MRSAIWVGLTVGALTTTALPAQAAPERVEARDYERAAQFFPQYRSHYLLNAKVTPHWRNSPRDRFTYRKELADDRATFISVDAATGKASAAFDAKVVAAGLSAALGKPVEADKLPFPDYDEVSPQAIRFLATGKYWTCSTVAAHCDGVDAPRTAFDAVASPDGKWLAFIKDGNIWVRSTDGAQSFALTSDAEPYYGYGQETEGLRGNLAGGGQAVTPSNVIAWSHKSVPPGPPAPLEIAWSPDSRKILSFRVDERKVREVTIIQSTPTDGTVRPISYTWRSAMPNDPDIPMAEPWIFDLASRAAQKVDMAPIPDLFLGPVLAHEVIWSKDSKSVYLASRTRYLKTKLLDLIDANTGKTRRLISETGKTFVEFGSIGEQPMVYPQDNGDVIWFSERTGFGHLYLYDSTGKLKRPLTQGPFTVRNVVRLDPAHDTIVIAANENTRGLDPYFRQLYRVSLKSGAMTLLTPEGADHEVASAQATPPLPVQMPGQPDPSTSYGFSPSGRYFLDTYARTDLWPTTVLRRADGKVVAQIEQADPTPLAKVGVPTPERFQVLAADGKTVLYGNIIKPSNFDPARRYPVLDSIYPGPQSHRSHPNRAAVVFDPMLPQAMAELGMIVITVDGRGSHGRSKAFHDESYGGLAQAGHLDDHVAAIRQLAAQRAYMDPDRVGIFGASGGGYATTHAMFTYPDFFKVGVADAGNHDQRGYIAIWGETFNGPEVGDNYTAAANASLASHLKGKLLLAHGDMDANVMPSLTLQVVDALIKANKDFDLMIVPNAGHTALASYGYPLRRVFDYFVRNLIKAEPPEEFDLAKVKPQ